MELGVFYLKVVFFWPTGVKHYGEFKDGEITGTGVRYCNLLYNIEINNEIYFGGWKNNKNHGFGKNRIM